MTLNYVVELYKIIAKVSGK